MVIRSEFIGGILMKYLTPAGFINGRKGSTCVVSEVNVGRL